MTLVNDTGFDPVFSGSIVNHGVSSRAHHPIVVTGRLPHASRFPSGEKGRRTGPSAFTYASFGKLGETPTHEDIIDNIDPSTGLYNVAAGD